jgi:S1-C subfamily serine protease
MKGYLPQRAVPAPSGVAPAIIGDRVFKVGRTTGLTHGTITDVSTVVGPVGYDPGECWFARSIVVEGVNGTLFSDHGDSGSAVVKDNGEVIGLLYAGNGQQTYVCPVDEVQRALNCTLL